MSAVRRKEGNGFDSDSEMTALGTQIGRRPYARRGVPVSSETIRVVLVDDHGIVREGLRLLLKNAPDITVVGEAEDRDSALALLGRVRPDVAVLDLDMPGGGAATLEEIGRAHPHVRVLILTVYSERQKLLPLLKSGARGYLSKEGVAEDLFDAIRVIATGEVYVRPAVARLLAAAVVPRAAADTAASRFEALSEREQAILKRVAEGYSGAEISRHLDISSKTVAAYKGRIRDKLGIEHRTEYVRFALEAGLLTSPSE
jgi:two-component system, NarL family, response regulator NreC